MAKKSDASKIPPSNNCDEVPIDRHKVYSCGQFFDALGIAHSETRSKYVRAGLPVFKIPGTDKKFIRGSDWYDFIGSAEFQLGSKWLDELRVVGWDEFDELDQQCLERIQAEKESGDENELDH